MPGWVSALLLLNSHDYASAINNVFKLEGDRSIASLTNVFLFTDLSLLLFFVILQYQLLLEALRRT